MRRERCEVVRMPAARLVEMSPTLAEAILQNNPMNRSLGSGRVERYAREMREGRWKYNGDTIRIAHDGALLDGQHRLWAVIESGVTVPMLVVDGLEHDVMPTLDTGRPRGLHDVFTIAGHRNSKLLAASLRWLYWYESKPRRVRMSGVSATHSELMALLEANPDFSDRVSEVTPKKRAITIVPSSIVAFTYAMASRADEDLAAKWLRLLDEGTGMDAQHPVLQLRERLIADRGSKSRLPSQDVCAFAIKSWNYLVTGKRVAFLRWSEAEEFPSVEGLPLPPSLARRRRAVIA